VADEESEHHADEMGAKLGFEGPVVPVDFIATTTFDTPEATCVRL
jgi:hypothetical protein